MLIRDGVSAGFIARSYLAAAARERLVTRPGRRLATTLAAFALGATLIGIPLVLLDSSTPANASSTNEVIASVSNRYQAAEQLRSVFRSHHFDIEVEQVPSSPGRVGSILAIKASAAVHLLLREIPGRCAGGTSGCVDAIAVPLHFTGTAKVLVGRRARPGETYFGNSSEHGQRP
ncbi:MAG: hypothetical protein ABSD85_03625 [Acidimicrobiales bacterium]